MSEVSGEEYNYVKVNVSVGSWKAGADTDVHERTITSDCRARRVWLVDCNKPRGEEFFLKS
jgi:hypothetical protein